MSISLAAQNLARVVWNRTAKLYRRGRHWTLRRQKDLRETHKHARAQVKLGSNRGRDAAQHGGTAGSRQAAVEWPLARVRTAGLCAPRNPKSVPDPEVRLIDCIAGYHLNPWTCGIAKFNAILARRLDLPVVRIGASEMARYRRPLLSLKMSEFSAEDALALDTWIERHTGEFELFLHAFDNTALEKRMLSAAARVSCGNRELFEQLQPARPDIVEAFCPGTLLNPQRFDDTEVKVFTFGMKTFPW